MGSGIVISVLDTVVVIAGVLTFIPQMGVPNLSMLLTWELVFVYAGVGFFWRGDERLTHVVKMVLLLCLICTTLGWRTIDYIALRHSHKTSVFSSVHDHILQNESSVTFLLAGKNPYASNYTKTELVQWMGPGNPAIDHVIALPVTFFKSIPFELTWRYFFGWYDDRISHLALLVLLVGALYALPRDPAMKRLAVAVAMFNPLFPQFFIAGRSDIIFLSFLIASLALLRRGWLEAAMLVLALALGSKHTAFFILPFLAVYLYKKGEFRSERLHTYILPAFLLAGIFVPFLLWDFKAFIADTISYPAGTIPTSYPINGYTLARILVTLHIIPNIRSAFPLWPFAIVLLPLLGFLLCHVWRKPTLGNVLLACGCFLCPFWFFSRFFHDNYVGVVITIIALAAVLLQDETLKTLRSHPRWKFWRRWEKNS